RRYVATRHASRRRRGRSTKRFRRSCAGSRCKARAPGPWCRCWRRATAPGCRDSRSASITTLEVHHAGDDLTAIESANLRRDLRNRLVRPGKAGNVRRDRDLRSGPECMLGREWLPAEYVERGAGKLAGIEQGEKIVFDQHA